MTSFFDILRIEMSLKDRSFFEEVNLLYVDIVCHCLCKLYYLCYIRNVIRLTIGMLLWVYDTVSRVRVVAVMDDMLQEQISVLR